MTSKDTLLDFMETYKRGIHTSLENLPAEALAWQPDPEANSIAVTLWHLARVMDAVYVHRMLKQPADTELWFTQGWAEKYAYDPRGLGSNKLGMLTGFSVEEMQAVPVMQPEDLLAYFNAAYGQLEAYLQSSTPESLQELAPGSDPQRSFYFWVKICLVDGTRHTGEIQALRAMWERRNKPA